MTQLNLTQPNSIQPNSIQPSVTIVVSPRERFSYSRESLESIYQNTQYPFSLVYVDGGSPKLIHNYLQEQSKTRGFKLIRTEHYLAPNQARNLSLPAVDTDYVLFIDNDVYVESGWLEKLIDCAQETDATVVCPLVCIGKERGKKVHLAGGEARIVLEVKNGKTRRKVHEKHYFVNRPVADIEDQLHRRQCEFAEFHCMLVKTDIFKTIGQLDEKLLSTREHIDFCLTVTNAGGKIYCEPESVVTYVPGCNLEYGDVSYFMLRWSDAWEVASLEHFVQKWDVTKKDKYFKKRYNRLGSRRHQVFLRPMVRQLSFGGYFTWLEKLLVVGERKLNAFVSKRYDTQLTP
ncbi:MAG: glycosyltransferase family 2 protein [Microcoleaceae cyanobacterium]